MGSIRVAVNVVDLTPFVLKQLPRREYYVTTEERERLIPLGWFRGWIIGQQGDWAIAQIGKEVVILKIDNLSFFVRDEEGGIHYTQNGSCTKIPFVVIPE